MTDRELMQMALDVMEAAIKAGDWEVDGACDPDWVLNALRARLAQPEPYKQPEDNRLLMQAYRAIHEKQPEPEPVAWVENLTDAQPHAVTDLKYCSVAQHERGEHLKYIPLYKDPTPCQTCEALARTVMMDQTYHDNVTSQREITDDEFVAEAKKRGFFGFVPPKLWLWKNFVDGRPEYWAFDNPYPRNLNDGDPQTIGQPCGYAIFKPSRDGSNGRTEEQVLREISEAQERS